MINYFKELKFREKIYILIIFFVLGCIWLSGGGTTPDGFYFYP